jgi:DNA-directed RNA polymerase subunit RPC12/RpoP
MKLNYTNGPFSVEFDGDSQKDLFGQIASFQEVFGETACGKCGSKNLRFVVRNVDDNEYYELRCLDCGARLAFGVNKKGGSLFPKRKDKEGKYLDNKGWTVWKAGQKPEKDD